MSGRRRLDAELVRRKLAPSREAAQRLIADGVVLVGGAVADKASRQVTPGEALRILGPRPRYVSRAGRKLDAALEHFAIEPRRARCLDAGSSTGGFTDCLLQRGAARVWAVDVGYGQLAWSLRTDPRVRVIERANIRTLDRAAIPDPIALVTIDVSFISLRLVLPNTLQWLQPGGHIVALVKPQFEVGKGEVGRGGIVRDAAARERVVDEIAAVAAGLGLTSIGTLPSPITGRDGNQEYLLGFSRV